MDTAKHSSQDSIAATLSTAAVELFAITRSLPFERGKIEILKGISLRVERNEFVSLMGPSGSGKSTLLGIIAGLDKPDSGQVFVDGVDITQAGENQLAAIRNQKVGMVFQSFNLLPILTAQENVEAPLYVRRHYDSPSARAREMLTLVGLQHRFNNRPHQLSGGEQQRVAIARALVTNPAIVVMDEPTGNLDQQNGEALLRLIQDLRQRLHTTFIIATHDLHVSRAADRIVHLIDGRIALGTASEREEQ